MLLRKFKNFLFIRKNLNVGKNTRILTSLSNFGSEPYLVKIGDNCTITSGVKFITHDASLDIALRYKNQRRTNKGQKCELMAGIVIYDNCMIGVNSILLPGVKVGPNSIIGSGSVVTKSIPEGVVVAGNPARVICSIDEFYQKIKPEIIEIPINTTAEERKNLILKSAKIKNNMEI
jgi:acetyltransferase-like isoleucine patch superfamily enzyme